jgi:RNA polymerase sigma factor (sigma-70 family)
VPGSDKGGDPVEAGTITAGRKRAAVELVAREEAELRHTARRYSLCEDDAEDAYQRALEILLVKAPSERPRDLIRWTKTVVKHEALAIRRYRERMLSAGPDERGDPVTRIAALGAGPGERTERREDVARVREALQALKPAELRSLTLLAAGCSYAEIGRITGFSQTKINRTLAEGRERLRRTLMNSEDGSRCLELVPLLSAYCDGEASADDAATVREHLRACAGCRARMRSYRAAPAAAAALAPAPPFSRSLIERAQEAWIGLQTRLSGVGGGTTDAGMAQVAATGGARGAGAAALAKALAICAGTVGGAAACVAGGVVPAPLGLEAPRVAEPRIERASERAIDGAALLVETESSPTKAAAPPPAPHAPPEPEAPSAAPAPPPAPAPEAGEAGAVEYAPPTDPAAAAPEAAPASSGSAAGEFGP